MVRRNGRSRIPAEEPATGDIPEDSPGDTASPADATAGPAAPLGARAEGFAAAAEDLAPAGHRADGAPEDLAPAGHRADGAPVDAPDTLSGLLAVLGRHLENHTPDEVMVLLREEMERRELRAYSSGWRDAAAQYEPALQEARAAGGRALRLVRGVPGQAAVIPLRQQGRDAAARRADGRNREDGAADGRTTRPGPAADGERADRPQAPAPALVPKSRTSRVPTIPRLRPPSRRPAGGAAPVTPDGESL